MYLSDDLFTSSELNYPFGYVIMPLEMDV